MGVSEAQHFCTVDPTAQSGRDFFCLIVVAVVLVGQALLPVQVCGG